jgi:transposase
MFYCGIDIGKRKHAVAILDADGRLHKPVFEVENIQAGLTMLVDMLKQTGGEVQVGLEATGHYWLALYDGLTQNGFPAAVINPLQIAAYRKSGCAR